MTRIERVLHFAVCALSVTAIAVFLVLASLRLTYPYELEWLEGTMVDGVRWVLGGHSLYPAPSVRFIPTVYNPLYFWVSAAIAALLGNGFVALRLVSILSAAGIGLLLIFRLVPGRRDAGLVAAGLYAASFRFAGAWMDTAKSDSLFLLLVLAGFVICRDSRTTRRQVLGACCYAAAFYTKQTALLIAGAMMTTELIAGRARAYAQWLTFAAVAGAGFLALNGLTNGWYRFYAFDTPRHFIESSEGWPFLRGLRDTLWPAATIALVYAIVRLARWCRPAGGAVSGIFRFFTLRRSAGAPSTASSGLPSSAFLNVVLALSLVASSWILFGRRGTYDNTFLPACLGLSMIAGMAYDELRRHLHDHRIGNAYRAMDSIAFAAVACGVLVQFALFRYDPVKQLPTREDRAAGDQLIERIRTLPGSVLVWEHGAYTASAGKGSYMQAFIYADAAGWLSTAPSSADHDRRRQRVVQSLTRALQRQEFDWVILDTRTDQWDPYYLPFDKVFEDDGVFYPVTGRPTRPQTILIKNPVAAGGDLPLDNADFDFMLPAGWTGAADWGRWIVGNSAVATVTLVPDRNYDVSMDMILLCSARTPRFEIALTWNGSALADETVETCGSHRINARVDAGVVRPAGNALELNVHDTRPGPAPGRTAGVTRIRVAQSTP